MFYLGVNWDHPAGASLLKEHEIIAGVSEERFSRKKNDLSFPQNAINYCTNLVKGNGKINGVGIASIEVGYREMLYQYACNLTVEDHIREQHKVWYPRLYEGKEVDNALVHKDRWIQDQYPEDYWAEYDPKKVETYSQDSANIIADFLGIDRSKVLRIDHHLCHAYYAYYASPFRNETAAVITMDGFGDGLNATLSIAENRAMRRIYATDKCILGRIYRHITLLMGMKPLEHEYKVMGLAPYAKEKFSMPAYNVFADLIELNGIEYVWKNRPKDSYFHFKERLEGIRFDNIAAGLQMWVEDVLCQWVENIVKETGVNTLVFSGGVSMNVKAMGKVALMPCVKQMFVPGSGADETCCIGSAIAASAYFNDGKFGRTPVVSSLLLGPDVDDAEEILLEAESRNDLTVEKDISNERIAKLIFDGVIIGRCIGRMEYGQRALGNRSILADPTGGDVVPRINAMIKNRDFWMPFAPVILDTYVDRYLINPKKVQSPHMTIAYHTTDEGWASMRAACHPADKTARAQILTKVDNKALYNFLLTFEKISGRGALLNTSFNLHGHPIVNTARDAWEVFIESGLEGLWLDGGLILKKELLSAQDFLTLGFPH